MQLHMESMRNFPYSLDWLLRRLNFAFIGFGFRIGAFLFCFGCFGCVFYLFSIVSLFLAAELQLHRSIWKRTAFHLTFGFQCILCVCVCVTFLCSQNATERLYNWTRLIRMNWQLLRVQLWTEFVIWNMIFRKRWRRTYSRWTYFSFT